jgi:hypothetical protein
LFTFFYGYYEDDPLFFWRDFIKLLRIIVSVGDAGATGAEARFNRAPKSNGLSHSWISTEPKYLKKKWHGNAVNYLFSLTRA